MADKKRNFTKLISWFFLLYFVILFAERLQSLVRTISKNGMFSTVYNGAVNLTVILSLFTAFILLAVFNTRFWKSLVTSKEPEYSALTITSGVILVSGMVHTEYTIPAIQFIAYGMLIAAMILYTVQITAYAESRFSLWYSLIYLIVFSMAIPVVYHSELPDSFLFHIVEAVVTLLLVLSFTVMLRKLFVDKKENLLMWVPFAFMTVGDAAVLWLRWEEEVNFFVLIFAGLSFVMFIVGKVLFFIRRKAK